LRSGALFANYLEVFWDALRTSRSRWGDSDAVQNDTMLNRVVTSGKDEAPD
jgi:hypothetical protein